MNLSDEELSSPLYRILWGEEYPKHSFSAKGSNWPAVPRTCVWRAVAEYVTAKKIDLLLHIGDQLRTLSGGYK